MSVLIKLCIEIIKNLTDDCPIFKWQLSIHLSCLSKNLEPGEIVMLL